MAEKLSIAATLFSLQIIQAEGKMGETMPKLPTSSEVYSLWRLKEGLAAKHIVIFLSAVKEK